MGSRPTRSGKWRCGRDAPLPKGLPSRYALEVKYDRTGRRYWISSDDPTTVDAITYAVYPGRMLASDIDFRKAGWVGPEVDVGSLKAYLSCTIARHD